LPAPERKVNLHAGSCRKQWLHAEYVRYYRTVTDHQDVLPSREITVNQVIARNIASYRQAAGLKQRELGERLGWPAVKVSEAERSWDGKRIREFDAQTLAGLSLALGIPVLALFLPPEDDGYTHIYVFRPPGSKEGDGYPMATLMESVVMADSSSRAPAMEAYRERMQSAAATYLDPHWTGTVAEWLAVVDDRGLRADRAERLRSRARTFMDAAQEFIEMADGLDPEDDSESDAG
jgi:transcriptional regulator with XRE-family HTH domain